MQDARERYERLNSNFENETQHAANLAAELKESQTECQRLSAAEVATSERHANKVAAVTAREEALAAEKAALKANCAELETQTHVLRSQVSAWCTLARLSIILEHLGPPHGMRQAAVRPLFLLRAEVQSWITPVTFA